MFIRKSTKTDPEHFRNPALVACADAGEPLGYISAELQDDRVIISGLTVAKKVGEDQALQVSSALLRELVRSNSNRVIRTVASTVLPMMKTLLLNAGFTAVGEYYEHPPDLSKVSSWRPFEIKAKATPQDELARGIEVEREHASTYQWIKDQYEQTGEWPKDEQVFEKIAGDHLKELKNYYELLAQMEQDARGKTANGTDLVYDF